MALNQADEKRIENAQGNVESWKAALDAMVADHTITKDVAGVIKHWLDHGKAKLDPAIASKGAPAGKSGPPYETGGGVGGSAPGTLYANPGGTGGGPGPAASNVVTGGTATLAAPPMTEALVDKIADRVADKLKAKPVEAPKVP